MAGFLSKLSQGVNKFSEELISPTSALGKLAMYLNMATGNDLGRAQGFAAQDARQRRQDQWDIEDRDVNQQLKQAQIQKLLNPQPNDTYERIVARLGQAKGDSYLSTLAEGPPIAIDVTDDQGRVVRQYMPRGQFGQTQVPTAPVGKLTPITGGPTQPASGGFR
jgi:hypothetical protein